MQINRSNNVAHFYLGFQRIRRLLRSKMSPKMVVKGLSAVSCWRVEESAGGGVVLGRKMK